MQKFFSPESIVIYGVSPEQANLAKYTVLNLGLFGYKGDVYCVGRENGEVFGKKIYRSVAEIGCTPDLAVFLIPAKTVPEALEACGRAGVKRAVIQSAGFSEFADTGRDLEKKLVETAAVHGMRIAGPNCIGLINMENGMVVPFVPIDPMKTKKGSVSLLAQSGGVVLDSLRFFEHENVGFSKMVSMGNKLNVNENDYLEYLVRDDDTKTIVLHLESIADGERLMDIAGRTEKPIIVIKANNSPAGREIAKYHTSALAGDDEVASAGFRQSGMIRLTNLKEAMELVKVFSLPPLKGLNLGILCRSGGQAVITADAAHKYGFKRAVLPREFYDMVQKECRAGVIRPTNPLDLGDVFDLGAYLKIMETAIQREEVDGVIMYHGYLGSFEKDSTKMLLKGSWELSLKYGKPVLFFMNSDRDSWFEFKTLTDMPLFADPDAALWALALAYSHQQRIGRKEKPRIIYSDRPRPSPNNADAGPLDSNAAYHLLAEYGLPVIPGRVVCSVENCLEEAGRLGYPVALKMGDPDVLHKTERKGVVLGIKTPRRLEKEFAAMMKRQGGGGLLLQKMAPAGRELILGGKRDREFGAVVLFGIGGIFVELLKDVSMRIAPVGREEAMGMINEIKGSGILKAFRGRPAADLDALAQCISDFSRLLAERPEITSIDVNPLILLDQGQGGYIVDVKIEASR